MKKLRFNLAAALVAIILLAANAPDMDFFQGHVNGKVAGFDKLDPAMFMAGPLKSKYYNEVWFNEMQFADSGLIVDQKVIGWVDA